MGAKGSMKIRFGRAVRGDMFRFDIWQTSTDKYTCMPIFVSDTVSGDETKFIVPDAEFVCTLHKDDYVRLTTETNKEYEGYIVQMLDIEINGKAYQYLVLKQHDNPKEKVAKDGKIKYVPIIERISISQCTEIKKCFVTTLGNIKAVKLPEKRMPVVNKK